MEQSNVGDNALGHLNIADDNSTIYLFGSELYCGWCLEAFTCPVRLKIHCHIEHLSTCSCGEAFSDKDTLCEHVVYAGCVLPPPFHWSHFVKLPHTELLNAEISEATIEQHCSLDDAGSTDEKTSSRSAMKFCENSRETNVAENGKMLLRQKCNKKPRMRSLKRRVYHCEFCPFKVTKHLTYRKHMQRHLRKKSTSRKTCHDGLEGKEDYITVEDDTVDVVAEKTVNQDAKSCISHPCCEKHRSDDIGFIVSCFSSPADGKTLCCDLCSDEFVEWEKAMMHVFSKHLSAFERWRATQPRCESENNFVNESTVGTILLEQSSTSVLHNNPTLDSGSLQLNTPKQFSTNIEHNTVDQTNSQLPENRKKHMLTTDECKLLVSSLCQLFSSLDNEREGVTPGGDATDVDRTTAKSDATTFNPAEQLLAATDSAESTKPTKRVTSHKCKFCLRVFLSSYNCKKHEAVCRQVLKCRFCQKPFTKVYDHRRHEDFCGGASRCKFCQRVFFNKFNCRRHEAVCPRGLQCKFCHKQFAKMCERLEHEGRCIGVPRCKLCHREFNSWLNCQRHEACCGQVKCKHCGKEFSQRSYCRRHEATCHRYSRCKFCPKRFFSESKRRHHEIMCKRSMSDSKSVARSQSGQLSADSADTVWKIRGRRLYYCSRCGFSASGRHPVEVHLMKPHVINAYNRLVVKVHPGHDYVGSMRVGVGHYQCSLCGVHCVSRSRMLIHLRKHSSAVGTSNARPESSPEKMEDITEEHSGRKFPSDSCARSCPKCSRSFPTIAKFLTHRAVCRAIPTQKMLDRSRNKYSYLSEFCKQMDNGRWQCKLCQHKEFTERCRVYRHIRCSHKHVVDRKLEAEKKRFLEIRRGLIERTESGQQRCKLCNFVCGKHILRHVRNKHADKLNKSVDTTCARSCTKCSRSFSSVAKFLSHRAVCRAIHSQQGVDYRGGKRSYLSDFCQQTSNGRWQCKLCDKDMAHWAHRFDIYKHIRVQHKHVVNTKLDKENKRFLEISRALMEKTDDGLWRCKICNVCSTRSLLKHIRIKHADKLLNKATKTTKQNSVSDFCAASMGGRFQCTLCNNSRNRRSNLYEHIRSIHWKELLTTSSASCKSPSLSTGDALSTAGKHPAKNTAVTNSVKKSHFVRPCPKCGEVFTCKSAHTSHLKECGATKNTTQPVLKSVEESEKHFVKPCPKCGQVFTHGPAYSSHLKWCERLVSLNRFMEPISSGWVRCGFCSKIYDSRFKCLYHISRQHPLSSALTNTKPDHMSGYIKPEPSESPADDLVSAVDDNEQYAGDRVTNENICKVENSP